MKRLLSILILLAATLSAGAQGLSVAKFYLAQTDMTAMLGEHERMDQNGIRCALIKIETTESGFTFDVGTLGVTDTKYMPGEIWLFVPQGVKKITIGHPRLGILRDYKFEVPVVSGCTYIMTLTSGKVVSYVQDAITDQYLVISVTPAQATVLLAGKVVPLVDGKGSLLLPFGEYSYRAYAPMYHEQTGTIEIRDPENTQYLNINLVPDRVKVSVSAPDGADIFVNEEQKGTGKWTGELASGRYRITARKEGYRSVSKSVDITADSKPVSITLDGLEPVYGMLDVQSTPVGASIYVDGEYWGASPARKQALTGTHNIRCELAGYYSQTSKVTIEEGKTGSASFTLSKIEATPSSSYTYNKPSYRRPRKTHYFDDFAKHFLSFDIGICEGDYEDFATLGFTYAYVPGRFGVYTSAAADPDNETLGVYAGGVWRLFDDDSPLDIQAYAGISPVAMMYDYDYRPDFQAGLRLSFPVGGSFSLMDLGFGVQTVFGVPYFTINIGVSLIFAALLSY